MKTHIISTAEDLFDRHGFNRTGVDRLTQEAGVSSRTLYKYTGGKETLIADVLRCRENRFFSTLNSESIDTLFNSLLIWTASEGSRGCLFLRALGETGGEIPVIAEAVAAYRLRLRQQIATLCRNYTNENHHQTLTDQILILFEGAVSAAGYLGQDAVYAAHCAATLLTAQAKNTSS